MSILNVDTDKVTDDVGEFIRMFDSAAESIRNELIKYSTKYAGEYNWMLPVEVRFWKEPTKCFYHSGRTRFGLNHIIYDDEIYNELMSVWRSELILYPEIKHPYDISCIFDEPYNLL